MKRKILLPIFYIIITYVYFGVTTNLILGLGIPDFSPIIRGKVTTDLLILFIGIPLLTTFLVLLTKTFTIMNFKIMKRFFKNHEFYYIDMSNRMFGTRNLIYRSLLPVLMALTISMLINSVPSFNIIFGIDFGSSIIISSLLIIPITVIMVLPIWTFKDSGVIRLKKKQQKRFPPEMTYFGRTQHQSYKGFTGITTPIVYFVTIYSDYLRQLNLTGLIIIIYPIFLIGVFMPLLLIYENRIDNLREQIIESLKLEQLTLNRLETTI